MTTPWQHKALTKLLGLRYKIIYKKGVENGAADALSCFPLDSVMELSAVSSIVPDWNKEVIDGYATDLDACSKVRTLCISADAVPDFSLKDGVLYFKNRMWIGNNAAIQQKILANLHNAPVGGHSGINVTYQRIKQLFAWPHLRTTIVQFVTACSICQQAKSEHVKYPGLLQSLPVPDHAWQIVSLDFIEGLPKSATFNCILVAVDKFSKYSHFVPLAHPFTAMDVAEAYMQFIHKLHGLPQSLISDRDRIFTSTLWTTLFRLAGTQLRMSSSYHPQTDGQTERVNQCLETFLRCFVHTCPSQWSKWLALAEYWYNTSFHSALGTTPFEVLYGHKPRYFGLSVNALCESLELSDWLQEREQMQSLIRDHLLRAQARMKFQADKHRSERSFAVGDWVYLKLQPFVRQSVVTRANRKLAFRFYGPFQILARVGEVAYKFALPATSLIHPVIYVSQLKKALAPSESVQSSLPVFQTDYSKQPVPSQILDRRFVRKGSKMVEQLQVRWSGPDSQVVTWENGQELRRRFPTAEAWGQASSQGGENVTATTAPATGARPVIRPMRRRRPNSRFPVSEWTQ